MSMGWFTLDWPMVSTYSRSTISLVVIKEGEGHGTAAKRETEGACPPSFSTPHSPWVLITVLRLLAPPLIEGSAPARAATANGKKADCIACRPPFLLGRLHLTVT